MRLAILIGLPFLRAFSIALTIDWVEDEGEEEHKVVQLGAAGRFGFSVEEEEEDTERAA